MSEGIETRFAGFSTYDVAPREALELFEEARPRCPVPHSERFDGFHVLLNYADVRKAMADWETFSSEPSAVRPLSDRPKSPPLDYDPPEHTHWRALFNQAFNARTVARVENAVRGDAEALIDSFAPRGSCDLVAEYSIQIPLRAICHVIGFDPDRRPEARRRVAAMLASAEDPQRAAATFADFAEFGVGEVMKRKEAPRDDFLTALATAEVDGRSLTPPEIGSMMISLLVAGTGTTGSALSSLLYQVLSGPEIRERLSSDPELVNAAVEEALRMHPPVFGFFRRATRPVEVAGTAIGEGEDVYMCWAAANRDPVVFEDPQEFRLDRKANRHLAFGFGVHSCPGAQTGRLEMRVALSALMDRLPDIRLENPSTAPTFEFGGTETAGIVSMPVVFEPRP